MPTDTCFKSIFTFICRDKIIIRMAKPKWLRQSLAILSVLLYSGDVGSDIWVGIDLMIRLHLKLAASVFAFNMFSGFTYGWMEFFGNSDRNYKDILKAVFLSFLMIPYTLWKLIKAAIDIDEAVKLKDAKM